MTTRPTASAPRFRRAWWVAWVISSAVACTSNEPGAPLEFYGSMPPFELLDQSGTLRSSRDFVGRVTIASFLFTRCPTVCPVLTMKLARIAKETAALGDAIRILSFSVDPEYDSPAVLQAFALNHGADDSRWTFLTGDPRVIRATVETGLKIAMERRGVVNGIPDIVHGEHFVLLDRDLQIRGYYDASDRSRLEALVVDATRLAQQPHNQKNL